MRASISLFVTALVLAPLNLNYMQNTGLSFSKDSETSIQLACRHTRRGCRQYRGSGRRMALNNGNQNDTLV